MKNILKKIKESIKKMPLVYMLSIAWLIMTGFAFATGRVSDDLLTTPAFAKVMQHDVIDESDFKEFTSVALAETDNEAEDELPEDKADITEVSEDSEEAEAIEDTYEESESADDTSDKAVEDAAYDEVDGSGDIVEASDSETDDIKAPGIVESDQVVYETYTPSDVDSQYYDDPGLIPLTTEYDYKQMDDYTYFEDAIFIGDSRMVGLRDYSGLNDYAQFAAVTGLTIYDALEKEDATDPATGKEVNAEYLLTHYDYGKVYICVGINELGIGNTPYFAEHFKDVLERIRTYQPDAVIFIQSIMAVSQKKNDSDPVFNNMNINDKNAAIARFADGKTIFYLNINEYFTDQYYTPHSGALLPDLTTDQVHVYGRCYAQWADVLLSYGV